MRQNQWNAADAPPRCKRRAYVVMAGEGVINAQYRDWPAPARFVLEHRHTGTDESGTDRSGRGPMVMVAENRDDTQPRGQARQRCFQTEGSLRCTNGVVSNDEVSGQQHQIRSCCVHLADNPV
jgi:hypothetical protein